MSFCSRTYAPLHHKCECCGAVPLHWLLSEIPLNCVHASRDVAFCLLRDVKFIPCDVKFLPCDVKCDVIFAPPCIDSALSFRRCFVSPSSQSTSVVTLRRAMLEPNELTHFWKSSLVSFRSISRRMYEFSASTLSPMSINRFLMSFTCGKWENNDMFLVKSRCSTNWGDILMMSMRLSLELGVRPSSLQLNDKTFPIFKVQQADRYRALILRLFSFTDELRQVLPVKWVLRKKGSHFQ